MTDNYTVPHSIYENMAFNCSDLALLHALFKLKSEFETSLASFDGWFFATNKTLRHLTRCSNNTIKRSRLHLAVAGEIEYKKGRWKPKRACRYRLLGKVSKQATDNTKALSITNTTSKDNKQ